MIEALDLGDLERFVVIQSETPYRGRAFDVRCDEVRLPDGSVTRLDIVTHNNSVSILPVDAAGNVWFVRQYRHAIDRFLLELPAGSLEDGETPEEAARRELREEIGMAAGRINKIGAFYLAPGYATEFMHLFLARDLIVSPLPGDQDEFLQIEKYPVPQIDTLVQEGVLEDAKTLASLFLARAFFEER